MASKPSVSNFKASPAEKILVLALMASAFLLFSLFLHPAYGILVYPDELRYVELARHIAAGRGLLIRNLNLDYQKILYPLFLAPAFLVASDLRQAYHLIFALNLALLVSTTLPVYLLSLQLVRKPANRILIAAFTSFSFPKQESPAKTGCPGLCRAFFAVSFHRYAGKSSALRASE